jgi:nucleoside-diphosphate-sugar epimerase
MKKRYGAENVISTDLNIDKLQKEDGVYEKLDVTDFNNYRNLIEKHEIDYILHLSGILSALGEKNPKLAIDVNINGVINALDLAREFKTKYLCFLFIFFSFFKFFLSFS